jgi:hypothetical protein
MDDTPTDKATIIPKLYKRKTLDIMIFTFIYAQRTLIPSITVKEAAIGFMREFRLGEEEYNLNSVLVTYNRVNKELFEAEKHENKLKNGQTGNINS